MQSLAGKALSLASAGRGSALRLQQATLKVLDLPSASDLTRLESRIRAVSDRFGALEAQLDRSEAHSRSNDVAADGAVLEAIRAELALLRREARSKE